MRMDRRLLKEPIRMEKGMVNLQYGKKMDLNLVNIIIRMVYLMEKAFGGMKMESF